MTDTDEARRKRSEAARRAAATKGPEATQGSRPEGRRHAEGPESYRQAA